MVPLLHRGGTCLRQTLGYQQWRSQLFNCPRQAHRGKRPRTGCNHLSSAVQSPSYQRFDDIAELNNCFKDILRKDGIQSMTEIQARTWQPALCGSDIVGRSQTGSGKTLAYLLPSLQRVIESNKRLSNGGVRILILAPTRELVQQIHKTAAMLTRETTLRPHAIYGGIPKRQDVRAWEEQGIPAILTATPGRLDHHLRSTTVNERPFQEFLRSVDIVVLDEMDRLLDMGFRRAILAILSVLPANRQTLLFSATVPDTVRQIAHSATKTNRVQIDCLREQKIHTVETVEQFYAVLPVDKLIAGVVRTVLHLMKSHDHKIIVFFPTTSQVAFFADLFNTGLGRRVLELRSPMNQTSRSTNADAFRYARKGALFTSDVSARGIDYPGVTAVVQVGAAQTRETYIHRLGRTARAGKIGSGILLLMEGEMNVLTKDLKGMDIALDTKLQGLIDTEYGNSLVDEELLALQQSVMQGKAKRLENHAAAAYLGLFAFYTQQFHILGLESSAVVRLVNAFAVQAGLTTLPPVPNRLAKQYNLEGDRRLNVQRVWKDRTFDVSGQRRCNSTSARE